MVEQTSPEIDSVTPPAGEANTAAPVFEPIKTENPAVEPVIEIPTETSAEPPPAPEVTPEIATPEPIPEITTAQMVGNEPLTPPVVEATSEPVPEVPTLTTEVAQPEPTPVISQSSTAPEPAPTPQGSAQPEPTPVPAQTQIVTPPRNIARLLLEKAKATIQLRKQKKLLKIMTLFEKKSHITNDEVEKLLHVSDATATRYLSELEKQGRIVQSGKTGHAVSYTKR